MPFKLISDLAQNPAINTNDRGLHYGDGLFETMLLHDGEMKYWDAHYERLSVSAKKLYIHCPDKSWFDQKLSDYYDLNKTLIIKIIINRGDGGRGLSLPAEDNANIYILKYAYDLPYEYQPVKSFISSVTLPKNKNISGIKHLNRLDYVLATRELSVHSYANESILLDDENFLVEGIVHNLFFVRNKELYTPDLSLSGVNGIMRQKIIKKMKQDGKAVNIGRFSVEDLHASDECFMCNSVQGIRPVIEINHSPIEIGPLTKQLQKHFYGHTQT